MPALSLLTGILPSTPQVVEFDIKQCLRKRLSSCECSHCVDTCPAGALSLKNREVLLNTQKCSNCMQCVAVCPNEAFFLPDYDFDSNCRSIQNRERIVFTCSRQIYGHPEDQIVPCLGMFSIELLLVLGMTGPPVISFNVSGCLTCENKTTSDSFMKVLEYLEKQVSPLLTTKFDVVKDRNLAEYSESDSRRGFISSVGNNCISAIKSQFWSEKIEFADTSFKTRRIPYKTRLIKNLIDLVDSEEKELITSLCFHQVSINSKCTFCPLCTGICPTGAIKIDRSNGEKRFLFNAALCSGCGLCVSFCNKNAIAIQHPLVSQVSSFKDAESCC